MEEDEGGELVSLTSSLSLETSHQLGEVINPELDPNAPALLEGNNPEDENNSLFQTEPFVMDQQPNFSQVIAEAVADI